MLLARMAEALAEAGVDTISGDYEGRRRKDRRTVAILAPTNKAASVSRPTLPSAEMMPLITACTAEHSWSVAGTVVEAAEVAEVVTASLS